MSGEDANGQGAAGGEPARGEGAAGGEPAGGQGAAGDEPAGGQGAAGDEFAWQDLVARYDLPADPAGTAPWPDRESLTPPPARDQGPAGHAPAQHGPAAYEPGAGGDRARVIRPAVPPPVSAQASSPTADASDVGRSDDPGDGTEEHFIPPPPPPLPNLDPIAKGAWAALFGGPAYLLVTTLVGWTVPGWAALLAVMAFVGGFAVIVMRLGDGPSSGAGPDNGAVL